MKITRRKKKMIKYEKSEWNEVEQGIKFNKINNRNIDAVLTALNEKTWFMGKMTEEEKEEKVQEYLDIELAKIPEEHIKSTIELLTTHANHLLTYKQVGSLSWTRDEWRIAAKPFTKYSYHARRTELRLHSKPISTVLKRWTARVEKHWENRANAQDENNKKRQKDLIFRLSQELSRCENSKWNILTEDKIREKLRSTILDIATGKSTHSKFSFGMGYSTRYVNEDLTLREFDRGSLTENGRKLCNYDTLDDYFRGQADLYIKQLNDYEYKYYKASEAWLRVMKPAYDKIMEV
jgi:hypothetical protein